MTKHGKRLAKNQQSTLRNTFEANSEEAWGQIKTFAGGPVRWLVAALVVLLLLGAFFLFRFLASVHAPELQPVQTPVEQTGKATSLPTAETELPEEFDESSTVEPLLSGARKDGFYTFLLFGTDKEGTNTDTIMVVSYDVPNQKLSLMSIPRDTMVNVGWDIKKINSVYGMRGLSGFRKQIAKLVGFTPDFYIKIDLQAFVDVVDLIGGVEFDVPIPMHYHDPYQDLSIDLDPGLQTLNGEQAMGLVRFRKSDRGSSGKVTGYDDTGRVQTQQAFLKAMFKKCVKLTNWTKISSYVEIFERNVESDLTLGNMLWFARQAMGLGENGFMTVTAPGNYYASAYSRSTGGMQSYVTIYGKEMVKLVNESFNPYLTQVSLANMDIMGINADGSVYSSTGHVADSRAALPVVTKQTKETGTEESGTEETEPEETEPEEDEPMPEGAEAPVDPTAVTPEETVDGTADATNETGEPTGESGQSDGTQEDGQDGADGQTVSEAPTEQTTGADGTAAADETPDAGAAAEDTQPAETTEPTTTDETPTENGVE